MTESKIQDQLSEMVISRISIEPLGIDKWSVANDNPLTIFFRSSIGLPDPHEAVNILNGLTVLNDRSHYGSSHGNRLPWLMIHKIRTAMSDRDQLYKLTGLVQLDDAFLGGPNGFQGRGTSKRPVYVAASTDNEGKPLYVKMKAVDRINKDTALKYANEAISKGCAVTTDGLTSYPHLKSHGYTHERVLSSSPEAEEKLHWVHALISNTKAFMVGTFHGIDKSHLQAYLDEFCYRFNRRKWRNQLFNRLLHACVVGPTVTYAELTL